MRMRQRWTRRLLPLSTEKVSSAGTLGFRNPWIQAACLTEAVSGNSAGACFTFGGDVDELSESAEARIRAACNLGRTLFTLSHSIQMRGIWPLATVLHV
eukprot:2380333-Pleurochrysis_carterae.AAC.4